jgi:hypothetical protein
MLKNVIIMNINGSQVMSKVIATPSAQKYAILFDLVSCQMQ